jgi:outer membrane protein OmpA-like peptidoglycan-associated protein
MSTQAKVFPFFLAFPLLWNIVALGQNNEPVFGKKESSGFDLKGEIYALKKTLPPYSLPDHFEPDSLLGVIYTNQLNIPPASFKEGFPGVTDRSTWFAIDYTGTFNVSSAAQYRFKLKSDDGSRLYIDGEQLIDNDGMHGPKEKEGSLFLEAGTHTIRIKYFQGFPNLLCLQLWMAKGEENFGLFDSESLSAEPAPEQEPLVRFSLSDTLLFATDAYELSAKATPVLNTLLGRLQDMNFSSVEVIGHTDDRGAEDYNLELSKKRAGSVARYFINKGIDTSKLEISGKGEQQPLVPNDSAANRSKNRRVEIVVRQ